MRLLLAVWRDPITTLLNREKYAIHNLIVSGVSGSGILHVNKNITFHFFPERIFMKIESGSLTIKYTAGKTVCIVGRLPVVNNIAGDAQNVGDGDLIVSKNSNDKAEIGET
ncbi:hypothetical protein FNH25_04690 [Morganella morganii]|nr:hypothetical protein [Morganella morganii]